MPTREEAWELLCEYTKGKSLRQHALAVEAAMRAAAARYGGPGADADEWGITGMLHDFDYEMFPGVEEHPYKGANILDRKSTRLNSSHANISYAVFCLKKKKNQ